MNNPKEEANLNEFESLTWLKLGFDSYVVKKSHSVSGMQCCHDPEVMGSNPCWVEFGLRKGGRGVVVLLSST